MTARARAALIRIVIALAVLGGIVWWFQARRDGKSSAAPSRTAVERPPAQRPSSPGDRVVPVLVARVAKTHVPIWLEGLGTVAGLQQVTVRAQVDGRLDKVHYTEGQTVKKGDVLAQIDARPFLVQLHQAQGALARDKAQLDNAKRNWERHKGLHAQQLVSQAQVDEHGAQVGQLEGAVKIDQALVEQALLQLDYAQVKAPIDGITGVRLVDAGNIIKANDSNGLVVITTIDPAAVIFTIPQDRLSVVAAAMARGSVAVEIFNRDGLQKLAAGTLAVLDNQINQTTATLRLKAVVPNSARVLWPNAFVKARMLVETREDALVVPAVAIQRGPQGTHVYIVKPDDTVELRTISVSLVTGDMAVIENGLAPDEQVVIEGANQLRPGGRVSIVSPAGTDKQAGSAPPTATNQPARR